MDSTLNLLSLTGGPESPEDPLALELSTIATLAGVIYRFASISSLVCLRGGPGSGIFVLYIIYIL
jgi:hypothetical protein